MATGDNKILRELDKFIASYTSLLNDKKALLKNIKPKLESLEAKFEDSPSDFKDESGRILSKLDKLDQKLNTVYIELVSNPPEIENDKNIISIYLDQRTREILNDTEEEAKYIRKFKEKYSEPLKQNPVKADFSYL